MDKIILDTHIFVWMITEKNKLNKNIQEIITQNVPGHRILISAITVWEIAMLVQKGRLQFTIPVKPWIEKALTTPGITIIPLTPTLLLESCLLSGNFHDDPADRMIVATAKVENATLLTRDHRILDYSKHGYINALKA